MILLWMSFSTSNALADFTLVDSDNDVYYVGNFAGHELNNQKYYVHYVSRTSPFPEGEGILYFDTHHQSFKIAIFENDHIFGFSIEGHWQGSGSEIYYVNNDGDAGSMDLYLGDRFIRKGEKKKRVKNINKK
jgi:hypothetical protein